MQYNKDRNAQIKVPRQTKDKKGNKRTTTKSGSQIEQPRAMRQKARRQISNLLDNSSEANVKRKEKDTQCIY